MSTGVIIIDKQCNCLEKKATLEGNILDNANLFKLCDLKSSKHFSHRHTWKVTIKHQMLVHVFAKDDGRHNQENKYDLPPPIDHDLYFGKLLIIATDKNKNAIHLTKELWETIYEKLFGGFEDLATTALEDENEPDELDDYSDSELTETGYLKDGFVVDDNELESEEYISE